MNNLVATTKATGGIGVVGVFIPQDPGAKDPLAQQGKMAFDLGAFWFKGQQIRTGQANVKAYNRRLRDLIHVGKATPSRIISHRLSLNDAPDAYRHFDARDDGWTKVVLKPAAEACQLQSTRVVKANPGHPPPPEIDRRNRIRHPRSGVSRVWADRGGDAILRFMTLEQLRVFVAVAERQHVTRAAEALNLAQSAVSAAIASLEVRHGTRLFNRVGRGIELTEAGALFLPEARAVLARTAAAELVLSELGGLKRGTLLLQASQTIASYWLPRHLVAFRRAYPTIELRLSVGNTAQVAAAVRDGTVELGFVEGVLDDPALASVQVARDQLVIVVAPEHPWASMDHLTPARLADSEWVLREPGSGTRSIFEAALAGLGVVASSLNVSLELPSNESVRAAVEAGMGATAVSASVAAPSLEAGLLHRVALDLPDRAFWAVRHTERYRSRAADALLAMIAHAPSPES